MSTKTQVELGPIQETLLIPLLGRAEETKRRNGLLRDEKAVEIVDALDYDFTKWRGIRSLRGATLRTRMFDEEVEAFLTKHPSGTVIEIGAGLNTRYERLDNGTAHWIEIDLPDSMTLRKKFFRDTDRRAMIAASALESSWYPQVLALPAPYCFVSEAVVIYFEAHDVERLLRSLVETFPESTLIMDSTSTSMVESQHKHDAMKKLSKASWFRWACDDPSELQTWGVQLERSRTFLDASPALKASMPFPFRLLSLYFPFVLRPMVGGYRINQFQLRKIS